MNRAERILSILTQEFSPSHLELHDESSRHEGHAGSRPGGETHYRLVIVSSKFNGVGKVQRHQKIYALLASEFGSGLHALSINASAPEEN